MESFEEALLNALDAVGSPPGNFAGAIRTELYDDDLVIHVKGGPRMPFPLDEEDAQELVAKLHQAPMGKGSEAIVDTSVRKTWEINPDQFEIRMPETIRIPEDPLMPDCGDEEWDDEESVDEESVDVQWDDMQWDDILGDILPRIADDLGIKVPISAELGKMLLHEEGAMFKAHTETEESPGMFGTLVIALPSFHKGGDVIVKHHGRTKKLRTSGRSRAGWLSWLYWYSDVSHEALPVQSGYRWVLTYNLIADCTQALPSANQTTPEYEQKKLRDVMETWSRNLSNGSGPLAPRYYLLDHEYFESHLSCKKLLRTRDRARVQLLQDISQNLDLDIFLAMLAGRGRLKSIFALDGRRIPCSLRFDERNVLQGDIFTDEAAHWYTKSALVIVPSTELLSSLFLQGFDRYSYSDVVEFYIAECLNTPPKNGRLEQLGRLVQVGASNEYLLDSDIIFDLLRIFLTNDCKPQTVEEIFKLSVSSLDGEFLLAVNFQRTLSAKCEAISTFIGSEEVPQNLTEVLSKAVDLYISFCDSGILRDDDGPAIFDLLYHCRGWDSLKAFLLSIGGKRRTSMAFILGILRALHDSMSEGEVSKDEARPVYEYMARKLLEDMILSHICAVKSPRVRQLDEDEIRSFQLLTPGVLLNFISTLLDLGLDSHPPLLADKLHSEAGLIGESEFNLLWIPFLRDIAPLLEEDRDPDGFRRWQQGYQACIRAYVTKYLKPPPSERAFPTCRLPCHCGDCGLVNAFLAGPQTVGRFHMCNPKRRRHIHIEIDRAGIDCTHLTNCDPRPKTLVVTKPAAQYEIELGEWRARLAVVRHDLESFGEAKLRELLADQYDSIMDLGAVPPPREQAGGCDVGASGQGHPSGTQPTPGTATSMQYAPGQGASSPAAGQAITLIPNPVAGVKRKLDECSDPTGED
ncbi:hypothetical protein F4778DRAFT_776504 [Xylariomycetidae sp. FL2044]|nr:hypothetical protein F4778DRAFT_776504 [Xylariomycetidae sp. FL2044]